MSTTSTPLTFRGRLPGVVCEAALPPSSETPLRLDVTAFVGFAERGPLDLPIALEDLGQYQAVFGQDLLLARTRLGGQVVYAALPTAVKAFFDNGGRHCYVVRVAGDKAHANRFRMPGLVAWDASGQTFKTVIAPAAWKGRWSDNMSIGTQLRSQSLHPGSPSPGWTADGTSYTVKLSLELPTATTVGVNDLLRLQFDGLDHPFLFCSVESIVKTGIAATTSRGIPVTINARTRPEFIFSRQSSVSLPAAVNIEKLTCCGWTALASSPPVSLSMLASAANGEYILSLPGTDTIGIAVGDLLRVTVANKDVFFFPVVDVIRPQQEQDIASSPTARSPLDTSPPSDVLVQIIGRGAYWQFLQGPPLPVPAMSPPMDVYGNLTEVDLLNFDLYVSEGQDIQEIWQGLQFNGEMKFDTVSDNYWVNKLVPPSDVLQANASQLNASQRQVPGLDPTRSSRLGTPLLSANTDDGSTQPRLCYLPLTMGELPAPGDFASPLPDDSAQSTVEQYSPPDKDGLWVFSPEDLFLDPRLAEVSAFNLISEANQILYLNSSAYSPDRQATYLRKLHRLLFIDEIGLLSIPDLVQRPWHFEARKPVTLPLPSSPPPPPDWSHFQDCYQPPSSVPGELPAPVNQDINFLPIMDDPETYDVQPLLTVQQAMVNFCAARADVVAVLSLPLHFKRRESLDWQHRFVSAPGDLLPGSTSVTPATITGLMDDTMLSYAAVYHPWLQIREQVSPQRSPLRSMPPDGTICGMIAARELARGPWIAPANVPLQGIVGLSPNFSQADWADLFNAHMNIVRQPIANYMLLSAHTLSADRLFLQISVRRLLIFIRKLALRRGMRYVFESNNERFRLMVQASFEQTMNVLLAQGAISAFQVVTGSEINTQNDYDNGRFLIALKIAPTQPIEFITVVLLRAGEGLLQALEG